MKLGVTLDILNQKDTPAFYADTLANRPAAGFTGRVFISTDTLDLYRDTGTTWVLLSPSSTGTITGSGAAGQVTYFSAASSITGSNDLFFDSVNGHLGIGTITPSTALTIFHDQNQIIQINQTTATNDTKIAFQNSGTPLWRIGNSYNAGANDYAIYDVVGALQPLTIKKTTGQTFIGSQTTSSGLLVVNSSTADNQIVAIGANSPSIRVRNAGTAPTQQFGLGLSTATNNFIQGSASGDFCIFNGSTTASPMLFGIYDTTNVQEAARISAARNFLIGTTTDAGQKLQVNGKVNSTGYFINGMTAGNGALYYENTLNRVTLANYNTNGILTFEVNGGAGAGIFDAAGNFGIGVTPSAWGAFKPSLQVGSASLSQISNRAYITTNGFFNGTNWTYINSDFASQYFQQNSQHIWNIASSGTAGNSISFIQAMTLDESGKLGIGGTPYHLLQVTSSSNFGAALKVSDVSTQSTGAIALGDGGSSTLGIGLWRAAENSYSTQGNWLNIQGISGIAFMSGTGSFGSNTERMTLTNSGNFLIGTTTDAGQKLQVNGTISASATDGAYTIYMVNATTTTAWGFISRNNTNLYLREPGVADQFIFYSGGNFEATNGSIKTAAPSGGSAQTWKLGNYTAGVAVQAGKVRVEINGVAYDLLTA